MTEDLLARARTEHDRLSKGTALRGNTPETYRRNLAVYNAWAERNGLPSIGGTGGRALAVDDLRVLYAAMAGGELRARPLAESLPMRPSTCEVLVSALRRAHLDAGLAWVGDTERAAVGELHSAYERAYGRPATAARPMTVEDLGSLFDVAPRLVKGRNLVASVARALSVQAGLTMANISRITAAMVEANDAGAALTIAGEKTWVPCIAPQYNDVLGAVTCAHCLLEQWKSGEPTGPLLDRLGRIFVRRQSRMLVAALPGRATFDGDVLQAPEGAVSTVGSALIWNRETVLWLEARAIILPMRALGLRVDDLRSLPLQDLQFLETAVVLRLHRPRADGSPRVLTLNAQGGPRCPVAALDAYHRWVAAFLPDRTEFASHALGPGLGVPLDAPGGPRMLYGRVSGWLRETQQNNPPLPATDPGARVRTTLTLRSAQRGFARDLSAAGVDVWEIKEALGHAKESTTQKSLAQESDAAKQVFETLAITAEGAA